MLDIAYVHLLAILQQIAHMPVMPCVIGGVPQFRRARDMLKGFPILLPSEFIIRVKLGLARCLAPGDAVIWELASGSRAPPAGTLLHDVGCCVSTHD